MTWAEHVANHLQATHVLPLLQRLLQTPSPQSPEFEHDPQLHRFIRDTVRPALPDGMAGSLDSAGNLVVRVGRSSGPRLLLLTYAMTHPASRMPEPFSGKVIDGAPYGLPGPCVWGRGGSEQKGALTAALAALQVLAKLQPPWRGELVFVTCTAGEIGRHDVVAALLREHQLRADTAVIAVGTDSKISLGNKGRIDIHIVVEGESAHSSTPWLGRNALLGAVEVLAGLQQLALPPPHPELGIATLTPVALECEPKAPHTIPGRCTLTLDRRLLPGEEPNAVVDAVRERLSRLPDYPVEVRAGHINYPAALPRDAPVVRALEAAVQEATQQPAEHQYLPNALDAGYLQQEGIPTVMYGPGQRRFAHSDAEVIAVEEVVRAARVYAILALRILTADRL